VLIELFFVGIDTMTKYPFINSVATNHKTDGNLLSFLRHGLKRVGDFLQMLYRWHTLARQRRMLLKLDNNALKDIGISRADAVREGEKPFWRG
jgi:uncharacterized protein YjiS (DUF1127 family)